MSDKARRRIRTQFDSMHEYVADGRVSDAVAQSITELVYVYDGEKFVYDDAQCDSTDDGDIPQGFYAVGDEVPTKPSGETHRALSTINHWFHVLMKFAREIDLTTCSTEELKYIIQGFYSGSVDTVKDGGLSDASMSTHVSALRRYYTYHDFHIEPDDIPTFSASETPVKPADMLTQEEIHAVRDATANPRDKLIVDLLLYTGQRNTALRTLRIKDINLQDGTYRYNDDTSGLKGADDRNSNRPLLGAVGAVRDWINDYHPDPQPDQYLITQQPDHHEVNPADTVAPKLLRNAMNRVQERTDITKPLNPHAMRHNFVTICKRDYDMDDGYIKWLIGHSKGSNVMETTYQHLSDSDYRENVEVAWGIRDAEEQSSMTPQFCPNCKEPLAPAEEPLSGTAKACPACGYDLTPDSHSIQEQIDDAMHEHAKWTDSADDKDDADEVRTFIKENKEEILNLLAED